MSLSNKYSIILSLVLCALFNSVAAQTLKLNDKVTISFNNVPVSEALETLGRMTGNTFSYNPDQLPASRLVKLDAHDMTITQILDAILGQGLFGYKQMINQVIIFRSKELDKAGEQMAETQVEKPHLTSPPANTPKPTSSRQTGKRVPDTVIKYVEVRDTVKVQEFIYKTDTIIQKIPTHVEGDEIFRNKTDLTKELTKPLKLDINIFGTYLIPSTAYSANETYREKINEYKKSFSNTSFSGSAGIDLRASTGRFTFSAGLALTTFGQKLDYTYLIQRGGFYRKDTLDSYYTTNPMTWHYIIDSTYIPVDNEQYNFKINNHLKYFEVPVALQYNFKMGKGLLFIKAGVIPALFIGADGQQIKLNGDGLINASDIEAKELVMSYLGAAGIIVPLGRKTSFITSFSYRNHTESVYKDYPIDTRYSAIGLNAGLIIKLY